MPLLSNFCWSYKACLLSVIYHLVLHFYLPCSLYYDYIYKIYTHIYIYNLIQLTNSCNNKYSFLISLIFWINFYDFLMVTLCITIYIFDLLFYYKYILCHFSKDCTLTPHTLCLPLHFCCDTLSCTT